MSVTIRYITLRDNPEIADIVRTAIEEFKLPKEGTAYTDPETDRLYQTFQHPGAAYFVAEENGIILGGCGVYPTKGLPEGCAELVRFFLTNSARGKGIGWSLFEQTMNTAKLLGYKQLYLESFPDLTKAVSIYEKAGFRPLKQAMGQSGHFACNVWMLKDLQ
jgi:putative acetyltransferase